MGRLIKYSVDKLTLVVWWTCVLFGYSGGYGSGVSYQACAVFITDYDGAIHVAGGYECSVRRVDKIAPEIESTSGLPNWIQWLTR